MSQLDERIARFETMSSADPENDMAHFSLGSAYLEAGRAAEAAGSLERCLKINPDMSKAYQLAGQAMIDAGWTDKAVALLNKGYEIAAAKGDRMPQEAMAELLKSIGREPPALSSETQAKAEAVKTEGNFICRCSGRPGTQLEEPPLRGPLGEWIAQHISSETWRAWIDQGTKVINEMRLDFSREDDQLVFERYMCEFLGIEDSLHEKLIATPGITPETTPGITPETAPGITPETTSGIAPETAPEITPESTVKTAPTS